MEEKMVGVQLLLKDNKYLLLEERRGKILSALSAWPLSSLIEGGREKKWRS